MGFLSEAEQFLLDEIRRGRSDGWSQLVERYQGRLLAFARSKLDRSEAEDIVQETFLAFLKGLERFRGQAGLETYLFTILRRKIIDHYRGRNLGACLLGDVYAGNEPLAEESGNAWEQVASAEPTASWYARRKEGNILYREALSTGLGKIIDGLKTSLNFRDLKVLEMLFLCRMPNKEAAKIAGMDEKQVAVVKHRWIKQLKEHTAKAAASAPEEISDTLLNEIWEQDRPSCLKRSTIGSFLLGSLDASWRDYVAFHLERLGCRFCRANLDDLKEKTQSESVRVFRDRILQSTIGFLSRT